MLQWLGGESVSTILKGCDDWGQSDIWKEKVRQNFTKQMWAELRISKWISYKKYPIFHLRGYDWSQSLHFSTQSTYFLFQHLPQCKSVPWRQRQHDPRNVGKNSLSHTIMRLSPVGLLVLKEKSTWRPSPSVVGFYVCKALNVLNCWLGITSCAGP
jgi:hypothetical protein